MVTRVGNDIYFDDLSEPEFGRLQGLVLKLGNLANTDFSLEKVLEDARKRTGLSDFGPEGFQEPLQVLLDAYKSDPEMTPIGATTVYNDLVRCASNRLIIEDRRQKSPNLDAIKLEKPLSISGLPRSGTTNLVNLLAADSRFQKLPLWEAQEPFCAPGKEKAGLGLKMRSKLMNCILKNGDSNIDDPRYYRGSLRWSSMKMMGPELAAMHPMNPDHIHEELELMQFDFGCNQFEWTAMVPSYRDYYFKTDQTPHYEYMRDVLKLLQTERGDERPWVLKCVQNPEQLPALKHIMPDATAIFTHRDPVAVIQSCATMIAWGHRMLRKTVDPRMVVDYWTDRFERLLRACVRDRHIWGPAKSLDVYFHEYMADQMGTVQKIYDLYGWEFTDKAQQEMSEFIAAHKRGKHGRVRYKLEEHFGVRPEEIRERFDFYFKKFPVAIEVT
ncbi:MAG: sulfotransferase [Hellea sp.]|nr:sulfotransferase [Hellea sp.]